MTDFLTQLVARTLGATYVVSPDLPLVLATDTGPDTSLVHGDPPAGASTSRTRTPELALDPAASPSAPAAAAAMGQSGRPRTASPEIESRSPHKDRLEHTESRLAVPSHSPDVRTSTPRLALEAWTSAVPDRDPAPTAIVHHERSTTERVTIAGSGAPPVSSPPVVLRPVQMRVERDAVVSRRAVTDVEPPEQSTRVQISIGRIEVHAAPTSVRDLGRRPPRPRPTIELDAYLTQRNGPRS